LKGQGVNRNPLVSVVIPVYNGEKYLRETIESVFQQDYAPLEVIVIDDGSKDKSASIARSYERIRYIYQKNQGNAAARNHGIKLAKGDYFALLDQDDLWVPHKLSTHIRYYKKHPEVQYTIGRFRFFLEPGIKRPAWCRPEILKGDHIDYSPGSLVIRRDTFNLVGPFNTFFKIGSDTEWHFRAKDKKILKGEIHEVLLHRRIHETNQSADSGRFNTEILKIIRESVRRKKQRETDE